MRIKVMSFNIQHFENFNTGKIDYDAFAEAIRKSDPDIIGLNEVRGRGTRADYEAQAEIMAGKLGMHCFFAVAIKFDGVNSYGNAILSKYPIIKAEAISIPDPEIKRYDGYYETRCILKARVDVAGGIDVFVSHFGLNPDEHENCEKAVVENVGGKCIFMGDLNVTPESSYLDGIRAVLNDTVNENEEMFSFPSDVPDRKIDYLFIGDGIKKISAEIVPVIVSDHRPYLAELELN